MLKSRACFSFPILLFIAITIFIPQPTQAARSEEEIPFLQKQQLEEEIRAATHNQEIQQSLQKTSPNQSNLTVPPKLPPQKSKSDLGKLINEVKKPQINTKTSLKTKTKSPKPKNILPTVGFLETEGVMEVESGFKFIPVRLDNPVEETLSINYRISSNTAKQGYNYNDNGKVEFKPGSIQVDLIVEATHPKTFFSTTHEIEIILLPNPKVELGEDTFKQTLSHRGMLATDTAKIFAFLTGVLLWFFDYKRRKRNTSKHHEESTTSDMLVSDEAVTNPEQDALGTRLLAKQLSLFLRNRNTKAPITLAITGQWGSGKSSIMGMLKKYLSDARYNPVWFNAWHHHSEEHLFGALLERIRQQAIPRLWTVSGVIFRLKLFGKSLWDNPVLPILFAIPGITWFILLIPIDPSEPLLQELIDKIIEMDWQVLQIQNIAFNGPANGIYLALIGLLSSIKKALAPFGLQPEKLVRELGRSMDVIKFKTDPGLRYKVEKTLEDITWAHPLMIFIDDLDRCPPEQVLKVLEFVNFLSSGNLNNYIVLGMDLEKVLPSISSEFSKIVEESSKENKEKEDAEGRRKRLKENRLEYAKNYLEKLVNIEVNVPKADPSHLAELVNQNKKKNKDDSSIQDKWDWSINFFDKIIFPAILTGIFAFLVYLSANFYSTPNDLELSKSHKNQQATKLALEKAQNEIARTQAALNKLGNTFDETGENIEQLKLLNEQKKLAKTLKSELTKSTSKLDSQKQKVDELLSNWIELFFNAFLFLAGIIALFLLFSRIKAIDDDPVFLEALEIWGPVINYFENTPRHFKRSVNQLRLMAMRIQLKGDESDIRNLVVLKALKELGIEPNTGNLEPIIKLGEANFVEALPSNYDELVEHIPFDRSFAPLKSADTRRALFNALNKNNLEFNGNWPGENDIEIFEKLTRGIVLR